MNVPKFLLSKTVLTALVAVAALIVFNVFCARIQTEQLAAFNEWYPKAFATLSGESTEDSTKSKLHISIRREAGDQTTSWEFPKSSLSDADEREQTSRVLQLISESKIFGQPSTSKGKSGEYLTVSISDDTVSFTTTIRADSVADNIQLQNLMKLLEIYASTPPRQVNPAQL